MNFKQENNPTTKITKEEAGGNLRAAELELKEVDGSKYFDQNEDKYGQVIDEATGEAYDNSGEGEDLAMVHVGKLGSLEEQEKKTNAEFEDDEAARFLRDFEASNGGK